MAVTNEELIVAAIEAASEVYDEPRWLSWAENWSSGRRRTFDSAQAAAHRIFDVNRLKTHGLLTNAQAELEAACEIGEDRYAQAELATRAINCALDEADRPAQAALAATDAAMLAVTLPLLVPDMARIARVVAGTLLISRGSG